MAYGYEHMLGMRFDEVGVWSDKAGNGGVVSMIVTIAEKVGLDKIFEMIDTMAEKAREILGLQPGSIYN